LAGHDAEEQRRREREAEQAKLDAEMEKRRKRIQAWQEQRRKEEAAAAAEEAAAKAGQEQGEGGASTKQKAWTLEDESSDEDEGQPAGDAETQDVGAGDAVGDAVAAQEEEEVDPLDAFMQQSVLPEVKQQEEAAAAAEEEEEEDPLDAFMQNSVLPAVKQQDVAAPSPAKQSAGAQPPLAAAAAPEAGGPAAVNGEATSKPKPPRLRRKSRYDTSSSGGWPLPGTSSSPGGLLSVNTPITCIGSAARMCLSGCHLFHGVDGWPAPLAEDVDSSDEEKEEESEDEAEWMRRLIAGKLSKGDKLGVVDHASVSYPPFRFVAGGQGAGHGGKAGR
jgi:ATP-dependent RNA helicase DDX46/PRP5